MMSKLPALILIVFILCGAIGPAQNKRAESRKRNLNETGIKKDTLASIKIDTAGRIKFRVDTVYPLGFITIPKTYSPKTIEWKTDNEKIIELTGRNYPSCQVKFLKEGLAKITVTVDGKSDTETFEGSDVFTFGDFMFVLTFIGLVVCAIIRWKFWNRIKKKKLFYGIVVLLVLMSFFILYKIVRIIILFITAILMVAIAIRYFIAKRENDPNPPDKTEETSKIIDETQAERIKEEQNVLRNDYKKLLSSFDDLAEERNEWKRKYKELEKVNKELLRENIELGIQIADYQSKTQTAIDKPLSFATILYADAIVDGFFNRVKAAPNDDTVFELCLQNAQSATFTIYNDAYQRIIANPSFLEGCDKQVLNNAQKIEIESEGTAVRQADGKWEILKKPVVIIL